MSLSLPFSKFHSTANPNMGKGGAYYGHHFGAFIVNFEQILQIVVKNKSLFCDIFIVINKKGCSNNLKCLLKQKFTLLLSRVFLFLAIWATCKMFDLTISKPLLNHVTFCGWQLKLVYSLSQQDINMQATEELQTWRFFQEIYNRKPRVSFYVIKLWFPYTWRHWNVVYKNLNSFIRMYNP